MYYISTLINSVAIEQVYITEFYLLSTINYVGGKILKIKTTARDKCFNIFQKRESVSSKREKVATEKRLNTPNNFPNSESLANMDVLNPFCTE